MASNSEGSKRRSISAWLEKRFNLTEMFSFAASFGLFPAELDTSRPIREALNDAIRRPIPSYGRWPRVLGILSLLMFAFLAATGVLLAFYYQPTAGEAYRSVTTIVRDVNFGWFLHQAHRWSARLLLVILLVSLSAYLRLAHSGIGCADWPECYGHIGDTTAVSQPDTSENAYQRMVEQANKPLAWATPLHRLVASVLGLLILFLAFISLRRKKQRIIALALLGLTIFLAVLGIRSGSLHSPAVVMGNLLGGFSMLGLLGWMVFSPGSKVQPKIQPEAQADENLPSEFHEKG